MGPLGTTHPCDAVPERHLSDVVRSHETEILSEWVQEVRTLAAAHGLKSSELLPCVPQLLEHVANMAAELTAGQEPELPPQLGERYVAHRLEQGFEVGEMVRELHLLRECVLRWWRREDLGHSAVDEAYALRKAIDETVLIALDRCRDARDLAETRASADTERALAMVEALLSSSLVGFGLVDTQLRFVRVNAALADLHALPQQHFSGRSVRELVGEGADRIEQLFSKVIETGAPISQVEIAATLAPETDEKRFFIASYFPVRTATGEWLGVGVAVVEISERKRIEEDLRVSQARLQSIVENAPLAIFIKDTEGKLVLVNERFASVFGLPQAALLGNDQTQLLPPEILQPLRATDAKVLERGTPIVLEERIPSTDGLRTFLSVKFPVPGPRGLTFLGGIALDITDRKRMEEELREREALFRTLADSIAQLAWMADERGALVWCNRRWIEYTGATLEEMQSSDWEVLLDPTDVARVTEKYLKRIEAGEVWEDLFSLRAQDGRYRWFLAHAVPIRDESGKVVRWFGTNTDVTEQRLLGEVAALLASTLKFRDITGQLARLLIPQLADWCVIDLMEGDGTISRVELVHTDPTKRELAREYLTRFPPLLDEIGTSAKVIRTGEPELFPEVTDELLAEHTRSREQAKMLRELGIYALVAVPLIARGAVQGAIGLVSADAKRPLGSRELELLQALARKVELAIDNARLYEEAQQAIRMREEILAVVSHDLKNPLNAICLAATSLLHMTADDARSRRHSQTILRSAGRMNYLIDDLLDMASIQAGRLALDQQAEDPESIIAESFDAHEPLAKEKGVQLVRRCEFARGRPRCDRERILQVLSNLLGNAIKFCSRGDIVEFGGRVSEGSATFVVRDSGPGIADPELARIFDPYWSAPQHTKKGTGLGLCISKAIIEAHGGRLWAESTLGEGTAFFFTLPLAK